jgi:hypothetical protein
MTVGRRLVVVRRKVRLEAASEYDARWSRFRDMARGAGAKAWRFRSISDPALYVEFLEFAEGSDPRGLAELASATAALDAAGAGAEEEWADANLP